MIEKYKAIEIEIRKVIDNSDYEGLLDLVDYLYKYGDDIRWTTHAMWEEGL